MRVSNELLLVVAKIAAPNRPSTLTWQLEELRRLWLHPSACPPPRQPRQQRQYGRASRRTRAWRHPESEHERERERGRA